jgi:DNA-binding transcriptional MerR regulator
VAKRPPARRHDDETPLAGATADTVVAAVDGGTSNASYTIDQLAQHTGVPGRTIRFYQSQGVLPSPRREGRVAYYDDEHVRRLHLIADLRDRGLRLDAIRDALEQLESGGDSLQTWLGLSDRFRDPWADDRPVLMHGEELLARYDGGRPGLLAELEAAGVIRREGTGIRPPYLIESLGFVDSLVALEKAGIDMETSLGAALIMRTGIRALADELVTYYAGFLMNDLLTDTGMGVEGVLNVYAALRPIGFNTLRVMFGQEIDRAIQAIVESGPSAAEKLLLPPAECRGAKPVPASAPARRKG